MTARAPARATLSAADFDTLGRAFAARSAAHTPSWAWVERPTDARDPFAKAMPLPGYLRASPLLLPSTVHLGLADDEHRGADDTSRSFATCEHEEMALLTGGEALEEPEYASSCAVAPSARLELHIVHHSTYAVPMLLLQGYHADGAPWRPEELRAFLRTQQTGQAPLAASSVSLSDHPVLCTPWCCVDPCETATLMGELLSTTMALPPPSTVASDQPPPPALDYLSAWWSVIAPLVGCHTRSAWFVSRE